MRGCVRGSLLKSIRLDPGRVAGALTGSNRYRMTGSKEGRRQAPVDGLGARVEDSF
jgi:hypothetical protein